MFLLYAGERAMRVKLSTDCWLGARPFAVVASAPAMQDPLEVSSNLRNVQALGQSDAFGLPLLHIDLICFQICSMSFPLLSDPPSMHCHAWPQMLHLRFYRSLMTFPCRRMQSYRRCILASIAMNSSRASHSPSQMPGRARTKTAELACKTNEFENVGCIPITSLLHRASEDSIKWVYSLIFSLTHHINCMLVVGTQLRIFG